MSLPLSRRALTPLLLGVCLCNPGRAAEDAVPIPDTPVGKQLTAWLKAYNSGDKETERRFITSHFTPAALKKAPVERHLAGFRMVYHDNRTLELAKIERAADQEITALNSSAR